jgi:hypothetical protein
MSVAVEQLVEVAKLAADDGLLWFDASVPGWYRRVDLAKLNIRDVDGDCLACQVAGRRSFSDSLNHLGIPWEDAGKLGLAYPDSSLNYASNAAACFESLRRCWIAGIEARLAADIFGY